MYSQIDNNKILSVLFLFFFIFFAVTISFLLSFLFSVDFYFSLFISILSFFISLFISLVSYYFGDRYVLLSTGAINITNNNQYSELNKMVEILSIKAGLPKPKVYIIPEMALNAFATGRDPKNSSIALTQGLINNLSEKELEAVIAHELAHIKNFDIRLMLIVSVFASLITYVADFFIRSISFNTLNSGRRSRNDFLFFIGFLIAIISPIIALIIQLAISRKREFLADFTAIEITRYPKGLIDALKKLKEDTLPVTKATEGNAHMFIDFPLKQTHSFFQRLFSTHPPIEKRIKALENL